MNVLTLQITKDSFQAILKGEQDVEHRYVYPSNVARYVYFKHDGKKYKRQEDIPDDDKDVEVLPVEYDALYLINGRRKDAPRLTVEVKSAEFIIFTDEDGNDQVFEENGKEEQQPVNQSEQKPEKKTSLLRKLDEKKKECAERDAKQQIVKKKRNHEMSL